MHYTVVYNVNAALPSMKFASPFLSTFLNFIILIYYFCANSSLHNLPQTGTYTRNDLEQK